MRRTFLTPRGPSSWTTLLALALLIAATASSKGQRPEHSAKSSAAPPPPSAGKLQQLIDDLDADEFKVRDDATKALIKAGPPVLQTLRAARKRAPSAEARLRLEKTIEEIELWGGEGGNLRLDELLQRVSKIAGEDWRKASYQDKRLETLLGRWLRVLGQAARKPKLAPPVAFADVAPGGDRRHPRHQLIVLEDGEITYVHDSIIIATGVVEVGSAHNSIIIGGLGANVQSARDSVVIAGVSASVSSARESVVIGGRQVEVSISDGSVLACSAAIDCSIDQNTTFVNATNARGRLREGSHTVQIPRLILTDGEAKNPLERQLKLTFLNSELVLFRLPDGRGEFVARKNQPITDTRGAELEPLAGWRLRLVTRRNAVFSRGEEVSVLRPER